MMKKVSIIIPVYNSEKFLDRCLKSIIMQTYSNIEVIVINDGSSDCSCDIIRKYQKIDKRIFLIDKVNTGVSDSRNIGIENASGEYICFVDADDWIETDMIEVLVNIITENDVDLVRCNYYREYENSNHVKAFSYQKCISDKKLSSFEIKRDILFKVLDGEFPAYLWLFIVKKDKIRRIKFDSRLSVFEDTLFYIQMLIGLNSMIFTNKYLYHYYCNYNSASKSPEKYMRNIKDLILFNEIAKRILINENIYSFDVVKFIDSCHTKIIEDICFKFFKTGKDKKQVLTNYNFIYNNEFIRKIINNANISKFPLRCRIPINYLRLGKIDKMIVFYSNRYILTKIKMCLTQRYEF